MAREKKYRNVLLPNELFRSSSDVVCADGTLKSASKFSHQYLQFTDSATLANKQQTSYGDVFRLLYQRLQHLVWNCPTTGYPDYEPTRRQQGGQAVKLNYAVSI